MQRVVAEPRFRGSQAVHVDESATTHRTCNPHHPFTTSSKLWITILDQMKPPSPGCPCIVSLGSWASSR
jgi:hypothetical protein